MMNNMALFPGDFRPPVFKIRAQILVWRSDDLRQEGRHERSVTSAAKDRTGRS
jgi:hypothetical protein